LARTGTTAPNRSVVGRPQQLVARGCLMRREDVNAAPLGPHNRSRAPQLLIIEDHQDTRDFFVATLMAAGFRCVATGVPEEAVRQAKAIGFDVVVMDVGLPRLADGLALAWRLSALEGAPPLLAVSGHRIAMAAPFYEAPLMKPIKPEDLVAAVHRVIGGG
jgi:DNA-binding response OmpR family regulator